jgi:hypothetical protein
VRVSRTKIAAEREKAHLSLSKSTDERFTPFKEAVWGFYLWRWKREPPWDGAEQNQLSRLLKASPKLDLATFKLWLYNYGRSENLKPGERPCRFLARLDEYSISPLDRFGREKGAGNGKHRPMEGALAELKKLIESDDDEEDSQPAS